MTHWPDDVFKREQESTDEFDSLDFFNELLEMILRTINV